MLFARREPLGTVVAITPWNFPIAIPAWKLAPALAFGNTVVWKPAELVPVTSLRLLEALIDAGLEPGVLNLVLGSGSALSDALLDPRAAALTFTGSNDVGRGLHLQAVTRGLKVQLELGGKNPAVVLADANLDQAAEHVARGAFLSAGQKCTATSRVIVDDRVFEPFAERLAALARGWKVGDPLDQESRVGPVASEAQYRNVRAYVEQASAAGGEFLAGGLPTGSDEGYFMPLTVVAGLGEDSPVAQEEIFGPVATLLPAADLDDALRLANATPFGLSASVFTSDLDTALTFAREIRAGVVKVNQESAGIEFHVPFGGQKQSSNGSREQGKVARDFFTTWKTVYVDPARG
jgi:aldehyde dehydrogenase (NAD+)